MSETFQCVDARRIVHCINYYYSNVREHSNFFPTGNIFLSAFLLYLPASMVGQQRPPRKTKQSQASVIASTPLHAQVDTVQTRRRTVRTNAGTGGRAEQLQVIGRTLEGPLKTPRSMTTVPEDEPVNPMAPTPGPGRKKRGKSKSKSNNPASLFEVRTFRQINY